MIQLKKVNLFFCLLWIVLGCSPSLKITNSSKRLFAVTGDSLITADKAANALIAHYKLHLDSSMNELVITASTDLEKKLPTGSLGSVFCDVVLAYAKQYQPSTIDFCLMNHGGLRIPVIYKGDITLRTIYELMPFENELELVTISGKKCKELLDVIAQNNGAPVSGIRFKIINERAEQIFINSEPFDINKDYTVLTSDYLANGGDKADALLNPVKRTSLQIKLRDALLVQLKSMHKKSLTLKAPNDERITR